MFINYTLRGTIKVPEGSHLNDHETGIILPNGTTLKLWEQWELNRDDEDHHDLTTIELELLGCFYDGEPVTLEVIE